jgi:hypothetical protein
MNIILFPGLIKLDGKWWHGGRSYRDVGELKASISPRDWQRVYNWDLVRWLRCQGDTAQGGGNAA